MNVKYRSCYSCSSFSSWDSNLYCSTSDFKMASGECIIVVQTDASHDSKYEIEHKSTIYDHMRASQLSDNNFSIGYSCQLNDDYETYRHSTRKANGTTYERYHCFSKAKVSLEYYDDSEIYESWKNR